jgi:ribosome-binding protein aMBF1 (putative translation factor)
MEDKMNSATRRRLESRGWKVGDAADFLGLTPEEERLVELRLALCLAVKAKRRSKRILQEELAAKLKTSQSRIAKLEACDPHVSTDMMLNAFFALGGSLNDASRVIGDAARK